MDIFAAAEWGESPQALSAARTAIAQADIVIANLLFLEEHTAAILPALESRRDHCDAMLGLVADPAIVRLTRMGDLDMMKPASATMQLLKSLKPKMKPARRAAKRP